jgi:hypothetical protein
LETSPSLQKVLPLLETSQSLQRVLLQLKMRVLKMPSIVYRLQKIVLGHLPLLDLPLLAIL